MSIRSRILALVATTLLILVAAVLSVDGGRPQPPRPELNIAKIEQVLVEALREELRKGDATRALDCAVKLELVEQTPSWSRIRLVWQVLRADGEQLGTLEQKNLVPAEMLLDPKHEAWQWAASAAALGVIRVREAGDAYALR